MHCIKKRQDIPVCNLWRLEMIVVINSVRILDFAHFATDFVNFVSVSTVLIVLPFLERGLKFERSVATTVRLCTTDLPLQSVLKELKAVGAESLIDWCWFGLAPIGLGDDP